MSKILPIASLFISLGTAAAVGDSLPVGENARWKFIVPTASLVRDGKFLRYEVDGLSKTGSSSSLSMDTRVVVDCSKRSRWSLSTLVKDMPSSDDVVTVEPGSREEIELNVVCSQVVTTALSPHPVTSDRAAHSVAIPGGSVQRALTPPGPSPEDIRAVAEQGKLAITEDLFDPESARFRRLYVSRASDGTLVLCGQVNAKNRVGGYVGFRNFYGSWSLRRIAKGEYDDTFDYESTPYCTNRLAEVS